MKCLRIVLDGEEHPHYTITKAFERAFDEVETVWWHRWYNERDKLNQGIREKLQNNHYDLVFMQIQEGNVIYPSTLENVYHRLPIFNWTGDVRHDVDFFTPIGKHCITLFSNNEDPEKMRRLGFRADYLQVGYDHAHYHLTNGSRQSRIIFIGNNYPHHIFAQSKYRYEMVKALKERFGNRFLVYGNNWQSIDPAIRSTASKEEERRLYNESTISINISHINLSRYYSDRQLRAMACGCLVLAQDYHDYEYEFEKGKDIDIWGSIEELINKCEHYLNNPQEAVKIGSQASMKVMQKATWDYRMLEFKELIKKYGSL